MTRRLGVLLLLMLAALAACGDDDAEPSSGPDSAPHIELLGLVHQTAAGGEVGDLTAIDTSRRLDQYVAQFRGRALADDVRELAADYDGAGEVMAAVIAVGCDVPPGAEFGFTSEGPYVAARRVTDPLPECLAAVTTVALVAVSDSEG